MQWWKTLLLIFFDGTNAARLPIPATRQRKLIDFTIEQTSNTPTVAKDEAAKKIQRRLQNLSQRHGHISQVET